MCVYAHVTRACDIYNVMLRTMRLCERYVSSLSSSTHAQERPQSIKTNLSSEMCNLQQRRGFKITQAAKCLYTVLLRIR